MDEFKQQKECELVGTDTIRILALMEDERHAFGPYRGCEWKSVPAGEGEVAGPETVGGLALKEDERNTFGLTKPASGNV